MSPNRMHQYGSITRKVAAMVPVKRSSILFIPKSFTAWEKDFSKKRKALQTNGWFTKDSSKLLFWLQLILTEDDLFNASVHDNMVKGIDWYTERILGEISLGGLFILVVIRTIQHNMLKMRVRHHWHPFPSPFDPPQFWLHLVTFSLPYLKFFFTAPRKKS